MAPMVSAAIRRETTSFGVSLRELRRVAALLDEQQIDVLHSHTTDAQKYAALLRYFWGFPSVVTAHNAHRFDIHWRGHDQIIALSSASVAYHRRVNRVAADRLTIIPNFVELPPDCQLGPAVRADLRRQLSLPDTATIVGSIGDIDGRKCQSRLVSAVAELARQGLDIHLVLIGRPDRQEHARCEAAAQSAPGRIHMLGFVPDAGTLLPAFDIFALASRFETLPLSILEAMAAGLPVVAMAVGGIPDLVDDGTTGYLVPDGDQAALTECLGRLARDPARAARMGLVGRHAAAGFSRDATLDRIEAVLHRAAESGRSRRERLRPRTPRFTSLV